MWDGSDFICFGGGCIFAYRIGEQIMSIDRDTFQGVIQESMLKCPNCGEVFFDGRLTSRIMADRIMDRECERLERFLNIDKQGVSDAFA